MVLDESAMEITIRHATGCVVRLTTTDVEIQANVTVSVTAPMVEVTAPISTFSGIVQCQTLIADVGVVSAVLHPRRGEPLVTGFVLRAPWYVRERLEVGRAGSPRLPASHPDVRPHRLRPAADSRPAGLAGRHADDDYWCYPVPVPPKVQAAQTGRLRLATHQLVRTKLRKLYQPSHNRFYVVVAEVLCDQPGLPRAGQHGDFDVSFVMRRHRTSVTGERRPTRRLARQLMLDLARASSVSVDDDCPPPETCETCGGPITCGTSSSNRITTT